MNEILTNEEIDTLLDMFRSEGAALGPEPAKGPGPRAPIADPAGRVVSPIDLLKPNRLGREQMRGIERYFESAGKLLSATIGDKLRIETRCDCVAVEQLRFGSWLEQLPGPVAIYVVQMEPFRLPVLFTASTSLLYGDYAAQPALGYADRRQGFLGTAAYKIDANWLIRASALYDVRARNFTSNMIGLGYMDDCLILALNYITSYSYGTGAAVLNHTVMLQLSLRTLGGTTVSQALAQP